MANRSEIDQPLSVVRGRTDLTMPEKIAFFHKGGSWYLPFVLNQAVSANRGAGIVLIGDRRACELAPGNVIRHDVDHVVGAERALEFSKIYRHRSTNSEKFELGSILRWFYIHEYMVRHHIDAVMHLDSDIMLFSSLACIGQVYSPLFSGKACGLIIPEMHASRHSEPTYWAALGHVSLWTQDFLGEFCDFVIESTTDKHYGSLYDDKWKWHRKVDGIPGGVSDMTYLYFFWLAHRQHIVNLAQCYCENCFDLGFGESGNNHEDEYVMSNEQTKKLIFREDVPYFVRERDGELIRVHAIHFQGASKKYIRDYYRGGRLSLRKTQAVGLLKRGWRWVGAG